jgi:hypothetical protein
MKKAPAAAEYLNVDLEVRSPVDLKPLVHALGRKGLFVLHVGLIGNEFFASFEPGGGNRGTPDAAIQRLIRVVDGLPAPAARLWKRAHDRVFDVGIAASTGRGALDLPLALNTVKAIARLHARVAVTVYPAELRSAK